MQVSTTWALTSPETVHHRPCMTREIETWLSESIGSVPLPPNPGPTTQPQPAIGHYVNLPQRRLLRSALTDALLVIFLAFRFFFLQETNPAYYYWYSITHSLFRSRLKSFLFCKSSLPQPFLFLLQDSLYRFPRLFTVTSEHIRLLLFSFFLFLHFF